ncbi:hypothetical protein E1B28_013860 [Marasmius oreades]|uniref:Multidrug resistance-associated ABC transporter n=1 Tax=Marasmius oreades TaxID=181124 RepID=A0A9P7RKB2_9AGAR|nr:uncharacterized protein E1B28_013860 [Marasmius oreades]KAG7085320.1 hypothetical protein E1B28_013860 [Marasmius oreades]
MGICGHSGLLNLHEACIRDSWAAVIPATFVVSICLLSLANTPSLSVTTLYKTVRYPFRPFLTLTDAEALDTEGDEAGSEESGRIGGEAGTTATAAMEFSVWKTVVLVFIGLLEVICWTIAGSYTLISGETSTNTNAAWNGIRPFLVAFTWSYTVIRPIQRPTATAPFDLFMICVLQLMSGVVQFGGILYAHTVLDMPASSMSVFAHTLNLVGILVLLSLVLSMPLALPSTRVKPSEIGRSISPEDYTTLWGWISFSWIYPLVHRGKSSTLNEGDVWNLSPTFQSRPLFIKFSNTHRTTLLKRLWAANSLDLILDAVLTITSSCLSFMNPFFLNHILSSIEKHGADVTPADRSNAYIYACLMFLTSLAKAESDVQHLWFGRRAATRIRSELMASIYDKALKRKEVAGAGESHDKKHDDKDKGKNKSRNKKAKVGKEKEEDNEPKAGADVGKVVNLMAGDATVVNGACTGLYLIYGCPFEIILGCAYLYQLLGWSAFAGFAVLLAGWPLNTLLAKRSIRIQKGTMAARDKRMGVLNELIGAVKFIKFFAWEDRWIDRAMGAREKEMKWMIKARINWIMFYLLGMSAPILISIVSFATFVAQGNELRVSTAFTAIALFGMIRAPLNVIPTWIVQLLNTKVALDRIAVFLAEDEVDEQVSSLKGLHSREDDHSHQPPFLSGDSEGGLGLEGATLKWNKIEKKEQPKTNDDPSQAQAQFRTSWFSSVRSRMRKIKGAISRDSTTAHGNNDTTVASVSETGTVHSVRSDDASQERRFELKDISVLFPEGELSVVTGPTASGKTALLMAVLGEMTLLNGRVILHKDRRRVDEHGYTRTISYAAQSPWLRHQTIKENILFGYPYDEKRYNEVVEACALNPDFEILEDGDETEIGARGVSLSGGQKARVALARAVYARTKYVLLDDPLSAVDSHTSRYLYENLLCGPLLRNRTVVLVTHHVDLVLPGAHYLIRMLDGRIDTQGTIKDLRSQGLLEGIASEAGIEAHREQVAVAEEEGKAKATPEPEVPGDAGEQKKPRKLVKDEHRETGSVKWRIYKKYLEASSYYIWVILAVFVVMNQFLGVAEKLWMIQWGEAYGDDDTSFRSHPFSAFRSTGGISDHEYVADSYVYSQHHQTPLYTYASNRTGGSRPLFGVNLPNAYEHPLFYVGIYAAIGLVNVTVNLCSVIAQYTGALRASRALFKQLLERVVRATFRFHDTTPQGRMLNRFGKDIETIDSSLAGSLQAVNSSLASFFASVITITVFFPLFLLPATAIGFVYRELGIGYLNTGRDLRRMESNSRSPIFSHFGELLEGIVTVRAFSAERQFLDNLHKKIDHTTKIWYGFWMTNRWLLLNFDCIGCLGVFITALFSISRTDPGIAGLCISSALSFTGSVYWACRFWTNLELDLNSVERVVEYLEVPQEPPAIIESNRPPAYWPSSSANNDTLIRVENVSVRYAPELPEVLQDVSFTLKAGERVGLLGRTGSGKSTLAMSVLRFVDPSSGRILIDGIDISTIGTYDLRSRLTFIPQDATLFSGTLRDNLDPFHEHTDDECLDVLYRVQIIHPNNDGGSRRSSRAPSTVASGSASPATSRPPSVQANREEDMIRTITSDSDSYSTTTTDVETRTSTITLSTEVTSGGTNFSQGQRQLLSLARALLRRSSVIVLDEATSSIDFATDEKIQKAIREEFGQSLLLTVAHRLRTVIDYDRLIVLDKGRIVEFDTPLSLIRKEDGIFRSMCLKSGKLAELENAAVVAKAERDRVTIGQ